MGCDGEIDDILRIRLREAGSDEEIFTSVAWIRAFNINELIYAEFWHEFYSTYEFDEACADDELGLYQAAELVEEGFNVYFERAWVIVRWMKRKGARTQKESQIYCVQFILKLARKCRVLIEDVDGDTPRGDRADGVQIVISLGQYQGVFEHMAGVYSVPLQGAYNPPRKKKQKKKDAKQK
nr:hypothetical protein [Tanacetum cinerariifolium]